MFQSKSSHLFVLLICNLVFVSTTLSASTKTPYEQSRKAQLQKYNNYKSDYLAKYEKYKKELLAKWGVAELSSKSEYISYNDDKSIKMLADFENDIIEISILNADKLTEKQIDTSVQMTIINSLNITPQQASKNENEKLDEQFELINHTTNKIQSYSLLSSIGVNNPVELQEVLAKKEQVSQQEQQHIIVERTKKRIEDQVLNLDNFSTSSADKQSKQESQIMKESLEKDLVHLNDEKAQLIKKNTRTYKIKLNTKRYQKAAIYLEAVKRNAMKWQLSEETILAIMETESHFNPMAKSYIPAYGLMQIVPSTAGVDVNHKIYKIKDKPTPTLLYDATNNINYGSAYFNILMAKYLKEVENPTSRLYCAIAAYNTGIGNLAKAFNQGSKNRLKAIDKINMLTPDEVYQIIKKRTHTETQRYLDKVIKSQTYFSSHKI